MIQTHKSFGTSRTRSSSRKTKNAWIANLRVWNLVQVYALEAVAKTVLGSRGPTRRALEEAIEKIPGCLELMPAAVLGTKPPLTRSEETRARETPMRFPRTARDEVVPGLTLIGLVERMERAARKALLDSTKSSTRATR